MTDEKLINDFLEKNYYLTTNDTCFLVCEKNTCNKFTHDKFTETVKMIFGEFISIDDETSIEIYYKWFNQHKRLITKNISDYLYGLDFSKGSAYLSKIFLAKFSGIENYSTTFLETYFNDVYIEQHLKSKLDKLVKEFDKNRSSYVLLKPFTDSMGFETTYISNFGINYLNEWYAESVVGEKIKDMLSQCVITLGSRNWVVTWIGHGVLTREKLLKDFILEDEYHHKHILKMFDAWYETAVIEASERVLNANNYGNTFPSLNLQRFF